MLIRPVTMSDHDAVLALAQQAGFGMTSLPPDVDVLAGKIAHSMASFAGEVAPGSEAFLFVLEDAESGTIGGTCGVVAHVGLSQPFYSYKMTTITQVSRELELYSKHTLLQICNDLTGASEIIALFLAPAFRRDRLGKMLSLSRFLFMAGFPQCFDAQVIAEIRGVHDFQGDAPFYNSLGHHFFQMPFAKADYLNATQGNQFINDLMPKYPIYMSLLPREAQAVIGQPNLASEPAKAMLEAQGFRWQGYVDVFDGGPTLQAERNRIRAVADSERVRVAGFGPCDAGQNFLMTN
jgi:arginine N-succinyltransferase